MSKPGQSPLIPLDVVDAFTQKINVLAKSRQHAHWYVKRAEEYLRVVELRPLSLHGKDLVEAYLSDLGRKPGLSSWQFRQCVEAVGVLLKVAQAPALREVDWHFWLDGAKDLGDRHATVGRERYTPSLTPYSGSTSPLSSAEQARLIDALIVALRRKGLAYKTEQSYRDWVSRFLRYCHQRGRSAQSAEDVRLFLDHLVVDRNVAASTQNQALNAIVFLFRHVYEQELGELGEFSYSKRSRRLPVVLTRDEVMALLGQLNGRHWLIASLLYGSGMRQPSGFLATRQPFAFGVALYSLVAATMATNRG